MDIVIAGGGYAGIACATRLARENATLARIRLINPEPVLVERIRLHQAATGQRLRERRIDKLLERAGVELVRGQVRGIDPRARTVQVDGRTLRWDRLVLALGSHSGSREVPGVAEHAFELEPHTAHRLRERLGALPAGSRVVVVGGGLTGIEAAAEIAESYPRLHVHLACRGRLAHDSARRRATTCMRPSTACTSRCTRTSTCLRWSAAACAPTRGRSPSIPASGRPASGCRRCRGRRDRRSTSAARCWWTRRCGRSPTRTSMRSAISRHRSSRPGSRRRWAARPRCRPAPTQARIWRVNCRGAICWPSSTR